MRVYYRWFRRWGTVLVAIGPQHETPEEAGEWLAGSVMHRRKTLYLRAVSPGNWKRAATLDEDLRARVAFTPSPR